MRFTPSDISTPWTEAFPLSRPLSASADHGLPSAYATRDSVGAFADPDGVWQFESGVPPELEPQSTWLTCSGFRIGFKGVDDARVFYLQNDVWVGDVPAGLTPALFSPRHAPEPVEGGTALPIATGPVVLRVETRGVRKVFVLVKGAPDETPAELSARAGELAPSPEAFEAHWTELEAERRAWAEALPETSRPGVALLALERVAALGVPCSDGLQWREEAADLTRLAFCAEGLAALGSPTRNALLRHLADAPDTPEGWIPRHPDLPGRPALPVWARLLCRLPESIRREPEFPRALERLRAHAAALLTGFPDGMEGLPQWPSPEAAPTPEVAETGVEVFDLAAMLEMELEALEDLAGTPDAYRAERRALSDRLRDRHFSIRRKVLLDRKPDGELAGRLTCATLIPLLGSAPPPGLSPSLASAPELRDDEGVRQWESRDRDPAPPPVRLETQHLLLPLMEKVKDDVAASLSAAWHRLLDRRGVASDALAAALHLRLLPYEDRVNPELETYPGWVLTLERHRKAVVGAAAALLFCLPVLAGILYALQPEYGRVEEHLHAGQADVLASLRRHDEAEAVYTDILENSREDNRAPTYHLRRGNLRYRDGRFDAALADYDAAIAKDPDGYLHTARWNRAQALRELGRVEEATRAFTDFIAEYGTELEDLKARAELAIRLMN